MTAAAFVASPLVCSDTTCLGTSDRKCDLPKRVYADHPELWCRTCWQRMSEFERFHLLYDPKLRRFIGRRVGVFAGTQTPYVTEEIDQEVMAQLLDQWETTRLPERLMYTIARREVYARFPEFTRQYNADPEPVLLRQVAADGEDAYREIEDRDAVTRALEQMPDNKTRRYLVDHKAHGRPAEEVAEKHGVTASTVKDLSRRGVRDLAAILQTAMAIVLNVISPDVAKVVVAIELVSLAVYICVLGYLVRQGTGVGKDD